MQSDEYEYYSDSSIEDINEQPSDAWSIYTNITNSLSKLIKRKPLSNNLPLSIAMKSRITVLTDLYDIIFKRYEYDIKHEWFRIMLDDLTEAIYGIAKLVDDMESKYEDLEYSLDTDARYYIRHFPIPLEEYLYDTKRNIIKEFNRFISNHEWLSFVGIADEEMKRLPLLDKLKIPENLIDSESFYG